jgi:Tfp pilus assembly protein PilZ
MIISQEQSDRYALIGRLVELIHKLPEDRLEALLSQLEKMLIEAAKREGDRKNVRISCLISVDYADSDRVFKDYIQDISAGGVFIKTRESFSIGEEIVLSMSLSGQGNAFKIPAEVVRNAPDGIGVKFKMTSQVQQAIIESLLEDVTDKQKKS